MKALTAAVVVTALLSGCAMTANQTMHQQTQAMVAAQQPATAPYADEIAKQLAEQSKDHQADWKVGLTHFIRVDGDYYQATPLSKVLSEELFVSLYNNGFTVLDYKVPNMIRVTKHGDFALSNDYLELNEVVPISHVLVGTLAEHENGTMVTVRLVNLKSKKVAAVAQTLVPDSALRAIDLTPSKPLLRKAAP
ncbi:hypothetical protein CWI84_06245 [Idiomarina tyrosinivorans]|uniref:FlgO domain-containing protein n=1 Tax=Idiomarina tyrosinivorans TaxID=1445662 RepID=A0A432ZQW5_9GAMM|nr:FlgO family outer membrane protein [Idiomarina tyrosinivorans]RUO80228.1 hypothetical protein CWI84_06245 [Idiomarina tyrosinivorans]